MKKKIFSLLTAFIMIFSFAGIMPTMEVGAIYQSEVVSKLNSLMDQYVGTTWNGNYYGIQCKGFANLIFYKLFDVVHIGAYENTNKYYIPSPSGATEVGRLNFSDMSKNNSKNLLQKGYPGDFIQVRRRGKSYGHSMILVNKDSNGITVFDCNSDGKNGVKSYYVSYSDFYSKNSAMSLYHAHNYTLDEPIPPKPTTYLSVTPGSSSIETVFSWNLIDNATEYDIKIWKGKLWEGDPYHVEWGIKSDSWKTILPAGTYSAYVDVRYGTEMSMSNSVEFQVNRGCKLEIQAGNTSTNTIFSWNSVDNATEYDVKIWKGKLWEGDPYHLEWGVKSNSYEILLPIGTYSAYVDTRINSDIGMSNIVEFQVNRGCKLEVQAGNTSTNTIFSWNSVDNATEYDVKIWKGKLWEGDPYHVKWGVKSNSYEILLPIGTYSAYVDTRFNSDIGMSNIVEFQVNRGCKLEVQAGNTSTNTTFSWNSLDNATEYDVKIWKGKLWEGDPYHLEWGVKSNSWKTILPEGTYQAYVDARVQSDIFMSNIIEFKVEKGTCPHSYGSWTISKPATCIANGTKTRKCSICGETETDSISATGHNWGSWIIVKEATCTAQGERARKCSICNACEGYSIPTKSHQYSAKIIAPTHSENGYTLHTCSLCGNSYKDSYTEKLAKIKGDINSDGSAAVSDAVIMQKFLTKTNKLTKEQSANADINEDGRINVFDLIELKRILMKL